MSENKTKSKKSIVIIAAALAAVLIAGGALAFFLGRGDTSEPTESVEQTSQEPVTLPTENTDPVPSQPAGVWHCICGTGTGEHLPGCDGSEYEWTPWTDASILPTASGYYYLDCDVRLENSENVANFTQNAIVYLDLNGHKVHSSTRVYRMASSNQNVDLTILDSAGGGSVVMDTHPNGASLVLLDASGSKSLTIYGGIFDGSALEAVGEDGVSLKNGALIRVGGGVLNIHGGTFIGAKRANAGGTVYVQNAEFNMTGGEIMNGSANNAGNVMIRTSTFNMTGGAIHGGVAEGAENSRGGNIFSDRGTIRISGTAEVYDGKATYLGENIFTNLIAELTNDGKVYFNGRDGHGIYPAPLNPEDPNHMVCICGGKKDGGHRTGCDGSVYAWRPWTETDSLPATTGYFYLANDVEITKTMLVTTAEEIHLDLNGHTVTGRTRIYQMASAKIDDTLTICDSVGGGRVVLRKYNEGGTFAAIGNTGEKTVTIFGGTYDASEINTEKNGAFMRVGSASSRLNLRGGTIIGGKANGGGAIHINEGKMVMSGGTVRGGRAENGGNIVVSKGSFTMTGGTVRGGKALMKTGSLGRGGNIFNNEGSVKISGSAKVYDGSSVGNGPNIFSTGKANTNVAAGCAYFSEAAGHGARPSP